MSDTEGNEGSVYGFPMYTCGAADVRLNVGF